jgi:hypothetical protein
MKTLIILFLLTFIVSFETTDVFRVPVALLKPMKQKSILFKTHVNLNYNKSSFFSI